MLRALSEAGIRPDVVVGTSVGAINGALVAADPAGAAARLAGLWQGDELREAFSESVWGRLARLARSGTHLHSIEPLQRMLDGVLPGKDFADLELPFHCVAASIERATARWFTAGPIVPAVLASCAVPRAAPPGGSGRRALPRRRAGRFHPGRPGRLPGRPQRLRPAGRADRAPG